MSTIPFRYPSPDPDPTRRQNNHALEQWLDLLDLENGPYVPATGGTFTGDLTVNGDLTADQDLSVGTGITVLAGQILADPGTAGAPGIAWDGDPDTGAYRSGTNEFAIATAGAGRSYWDANGYFHHVTEYVELDRAAAQRIRKSGSGEFILEQAVNNNQIIRNSGGGDIYIQTNNGSNRNRIWIDQSASTIQFYDNNGSRILQLTSGNFDFDNVFRTEAITNGKRYHFESGAGCYIDVTRSGTFDQMDITANDEIRMYVGSNVAMVFDNASFTPEARVSNELTIQNVTTTGSGSYNETVWHSSDYRLMRFTSDARHKKWITDAPITIDQVWAGIEATQLRQFAMRKGFGTGIKAEDEGIIGYIAHEFQEAWGNHKESGPRDTEGVPTGWSKPWQQMMHNEALKDLHARVSALEAA